MRRSRSTTSHEAFIEAHLDIVRPPNNNGEYTCRCPFPGHDDLDPSFSINRKTGLWFCHGCQIGGALRTLRMLMRQGKPEQDLAERFNMRSFGKSP